MGAGSPAPVGGADGRDQIAARVTEVLDRLRLPYEVHEIDPEFADTAAYCARYGMPLDRSANTIVVASKREPRRYCACVALATTRLDINHAVRRLMGASRVSFATAEETSALTGMLIGGVTVFALPDDLPIFVDERVMAPDWIILGGGSRSCKIKVSPDVFRRLPGARLVANLAVPADA